MRLFIAVNLSERSRDLIQRKVNIIKNKVSEDVKWVKPENWHLTLKFLGDVNPSKISKIKELVQNSGKQFSQFAVKFKGIGAFPRLDYPRVLFINVTRGCEKLIRIQKNLEKELQTLGFDPEHKDYIPHLTLARSRDQTDLKEFYSSLKNFTDEHFINIYMDVTCINLMESQLKPEGPIYENKLQISLKNS